MMKKWQTITAATLSVILTASTADASLEDDKAGYDKKAEDLKSKSNALQSKIESLSEEKRLVDAEADEAQAAYRAFLTDRKAIKAMVKEDCLENNIPEDL